MIMLLLMVCSMVLEGVRWSALGPQSDLIPHDTVIAATLVVALGNQIGKICPTIVPQLIKSSRLSYSA